MAFSYLIPIITWLPPGHDCTVILPYETVGRLLRPGRVEIRHYWRIYHASYCIEENERRLAFEDGRLIRGEAGPVTWRAGKAELDPDGGYLEYGLESLDDSNAFNVKEMPSFYNVYDSPGRKSFFTCHTWKFGSPQVINQIAESGKFVDTYPVIHVDLERDIGDSLVLLNPYEKGIVADLMTSDGRTLPRRRVEPRSVLRVPMTDILEKGEQRWFGQIQLTANNRVITFIAKHSIADPQNLSTVEHLDPFRFDGTHIPWFQWLRLQYGYWRAKKPRR